MAEGWARYLAEDGINIKSAGIFVGNLHPLTVEVMRQAGIDISHHEAKPISNDLIKWANVIITVCDTVKPYFTLFPDSVTHHHWSIPNPDGMVDDEMTQEEAYSHIRDKIGEHIREYLESLPE
jgi:arsenate reductase